MPGNEQGGKAARAAQIIKYGGPQGYAEEMRRRAGLRKTRSGGKGTFKENSLRAKQGWEKRRGKNKTISV